MTMIGVVLALPALMASSLCWAPPAIAFEVGSLKSGMSLADVKALEETRGWTLERDQEQASGDYLLVKPDGARAVVQFCDEHLFAISAQVPDGFKGLTALVEDWTERYGNPSVSADLSPEGFEPVIVSLGFSWARDGGEHIDIDYGAADDLSRDGLQLNPNATFLLDDSMSVCGR